MVYLVADSASVTVLRSVASTAYGTYNLNVPEGIDLDDIHQFGAPGNQLGYVSTLTKRRVGRFFRKFIRADVSVTAANPADPDWQAESNVDAVLREAEERVSGDFFLESDISKAGLGSWIPFVDFNVGDLVHVEIWGRVVQLPVTRIEPIVSDHDIIDWKVHVGGQLISDDDARIAENQVIYRALVQDRRDLAGLSKQVTQAVKDSSEAKANASDALDAVNDADGVIQGEVKKARDFSEEAKRHSDLARQYSDTSAEHNAVAQEWAGKAWEFSENSSKYSLQSSQYSASSIAHSAQSLQYSEESSRYSALSQGYSAESLIHSQESFKHSEKSLEHSNKSFEHSEAARGYSDTAASYLSTIKQHAADAAAASDASSEHSKESKAASEQSSQSSREATEAKDLSLDALRDAERARDTAEGHRRDAESSRDEAEQARKRGFAAMASSHSSMLAAEQSRADAEDERSLAELARSEAETARSSAESDRSRAETARSAAEKARDDAEKERSAAEKDRSAAEDARDKAETWRNQAEDARKRGFAAMASSHSSMLAAEQSRADAEDERAKAELARADAEDRREAAEQERQKAEEARQQTVEAFTQTQNEIDDMQNDAIVALEDQAAEIAALQNRVMNMAMVESLGSTHPDVTTEGYAVAPGDPPDPGYDIKLANAAPGTKVHADFYDRVGTGGELTYVTSRIYAVSSGVLRFHVTSLNCVVNMMWARPSVQTVPINLSRVAGLSMNQSAWTDVPGLSIQANGRVTSGQLTIRATWSAANRGSIYGIRVLVGTSVFKSFTTTNLGPLSFLGNGESRYTVSVANLKLAKNQTLKVQVYSGASGASQRALKSATAQGSWIEHAA